MHPSSEVAREYLVRLRGRPGPEVLRQVLTGVPLEDGPARFDSLAAGEAEGEDPADASHSTFRVVLHEGRNREVRRLWNAVGFDVSRLLRIRYGPIELPRDMRPGTVRRVEGEWLARLDQAIPPRAPSAGLPGPPGAARGSSRRPGRGAKRSLPSK
jgi:23S rRNA pseudouridine2605 synthase